MRGWLAAVAALLLLLPSTALASHTSMYALNPVEHDDQGRGTEPDGAQTVVLGPLVRNKVADWDGDGVADPDPDLLPPPPAGHSRFLNPGCMGDGEVPFDGHNRLSGQCGLWTTGAGHAATGTLLPRHTVPPPASEDGRCGPFGAQSYPPGRFSGNACPGRVVRFLDALHHACTSAAGVTYVEVNRKVEDTALAGTPVGQDAVLGPTCIWAWYGDWQDKNGNGVIDSRATFHPPTANGGCNTPCDGRDTVASHFPDEEFTWSGNCLKFPGLPNPAAVRSGYCALDVEAAAGGTTVMAGWLWPGNHHSSCGGALDPLFLTCWYIPPDFPGRQVVHFVGAAGWHATGLTRAPCSPTAGNPNLGVFCAGGFDTFDEADAALYGDPLLGEQDVARVDAEFTDRTGDPAATVRQWVYGLGWAVYLYDQSALVRLVSVAGVGCAPGTSNGLNLASCRFADVDRFESWNPMVEALLQGAVKPLARGAWVLVRDAYVPLSFNVDALANHRLASADTIKGPLDDLAIDRGFSREPNDPRDRYPGAVFNARGCATPSPENGFQDGQRMHHGWCNDYAAHREGPRAYGDLWAETAVTQPLYLFCTFTCIVGLGLSTAAIDPIPAAGGIGAMQGDHRRTLIPGRHVLTGFWGEWQDHQHAWSEDVLVELPAIDVVEGVHTNPPDGWVGNLVENIGAWYYRGYPDEACDTDQPAWAGPNGELHSWAECHPYRDGQVQNPQGYGRGAVTSNTSGVTEWEGRCHGVGHGGALPPPAGVPDTGVVTLAPEDGVWGPAPVLVWRNYAQGIRITTTGGLTIDGLNIVDLTGTAGPIELRAACWYGAQQGGVYIYDMLVLPAGNLDETFTTTIDVSLGWDVVRDVDTYHAWGV